MKAPTPGIERATLHYLTDLAQHNDREWFQAHRNRYEAALSNMHVFTQALIERMNKHDRISTTSAKEAMFRIYNDQRFHKDRPPYKEHFAGGLDRVKPTLRGGYYFHIQPGATFIGCGFWNPEKEDLRRIRMDILYDHAVWEKLLRGKPLQAHWGKLDTEGQLKTAPRGFPKEHPAMDLLRLNHFTFRHGFSDKEVLAPAFVDQVDAHFKAIRPWFNHMSEVLATDGNGDSLA